MEKRQKNGFTLIELVVVLVLLGIIMAIAIPSISSTIERHKEKEKNDKIKLIISAAELYTRTHKNSISQDTSKTTYTITIDTLINEKLLDREQVKDPFNDSNIILGYVEYDKMSDTYSWKNS